MVARVATVSRHTDATPEAVLRGFKGRMFDSCHIGTITPRRFYTSAPFGLASWAFLSSDLCKNDRRILDLCGVLRTVLCGFAGTIKRLRENAAAEPPVLRLEPPA